MAGSIAGAHARDEQRCTKQLVRAVGERADVRIQSAYPPSDGSEPEPDVAVIPSGNDDDARPSEAL